MSEHPTKKTILLVEDEALIAMDERAFLEKHGYRVEVAHNALRAIELGRDPSVDLILMDIDLGDPEKDGTLVAEEILGVRTVPIIFLTSHAERQMVERVRGITRYGYLLKNSGQFVLLQSIEMAFELYEAQRSVDRENRERREAELAASFNEALYRSLMENSIDAIYLLSETGKVLSVNRVACDMLGYSAEELLDLTIDDIDPNYPSRQFVAFWRDQPEGASLLFDTQHKKKDGELLDVEVNGIFFVLHNEKYLFGVARDIGRRRKLQQNLRESEAKYRRYFEATPSLIMEMDADTHEVLSCNAAMAKSLGVPAHQIVGRSAAEFLREAVLTNRVANGVRALATDEIVEAVESRDGRHFKVTYIPATESARRLVVSVAVDVSELISAQIRLEEEKENFRALAEGAGLGITVLQDGKILFVNATASTIAGIPAEEMRGLSIEDMIGAIHPGERERVAAMYREQVSLSPSEEWERQSFAPIEYRHVRQNGDVVWVVAHATAMFYNGSPALVVVHEDITQAKETASALERKTHQLERGEEIANLGSWEWDIESDSWAFSDQWRKIHGVSESHLSTAELLTLAHPDDMQKIQQAFERALSGEGRYDVEHRIVRRDTKEVRYGHAIGEVDMDPVSGKAVRMVGTALDITDYVRREEQLREAQLIQAEIVKAARVGLWDWNVETNKVKYSAEWKQQLGYEDDEIGDDLEEFSSRVHPEDSARVAAEVKKSIENRAQGHETRFRFRHKDGSYRWILAQGSVVSDVQGKAVRMIGSHIDITSLKEAEDRLRKANEKKELLMRELNHRVKNNLLLVSSLIDLKDAELGSAASISDVRSRVDSIKALHELLQYAEDPTWVSVERYLGDVVRTAFSAADYPVNTIIDIPDCRLPVSTAVSLGLIVNEIATNALKHGFADGETAEFRVAMESHGSEYLLSVSSSGRPLPEHVNFENPASFGIGLIGALVAQIRATIEVSRAPQPEFTIRFSLDK